MSEKQWTDDERSEAFERGLRTMEGIALELYRRGREPLLEELEAVKRERDQARDKYEALAVLVDGYRRERDEARAEVERLQETKDYLRTWLSSEELEGLRVKAAEHPLLWEEIHHLKDEVERLRVELIRAGSRECDIAACNCGTWHHQNPRAAYRRGAEAMREACAQWFREHDESFELTVDACHDVIADMPIPEEP